MGVFADVPVRLLPTTRRRGAHNMALDAVAADRAAIDGIASVRVYGWEPSCLSLGYAQDPATVDWDACEVAGVEVTRRPTGGGAIYHDRVGDISYSIVAPADPLPSDLMDCYAILCEPILDAFRRMRVEATFTTSERPAVHEPACYLRELHPSHDIVVPEEPHDRKISGNAQYRRRSAVVQHGSLTYRLLPERQRACFTADLDEATFRSRMTGIEEQAGIGRAAAIGHLEDALREWSGGEPASWSARERAAADRLVAKTFDAAAWVRDRRDPLAEV